jgi:hypothetical protein
MTNHEKIARNLKIIGEALDSVSYLLDSEIIGEDARHLAGDIKSAQREHINLDADSIKEVYDVKCLYDEIRRVEFGVRVLQNNAERCRQAIEQCKEAAHSIAEEIQSTNQDDEL